MPYYEDFKVGQKITSIGRTITDGMATILISVVGFVAPFFNDETVANKIPFGWRLLPGRIALALMGGLVEQIFLTHFPDHGLGPLVGIDKVIFRAPLRVNDTVHLELEVTEARRTSNPNWGLVKNRETLVNQKGEVICQAEITHLFGYRTASE
jgi:acyl dehydratase